MKVICKKWKTCVRDCGAQKPHEDSCCEPCPWDDHVECIEVACRECGCTEDDCSQCIAATGKPCHWVETDLCSRCKDELDAAAATAAAIGYPEIDEFQVQGPGAAR